MGQSHTKPSPQSTQFVFDGKTKMFTLGLTVIGFICLALTFVFDSVELNGHHTYAVFWTNFLHNTVFFTGIAFAALFFIATHTLAWGGWFVIFKRIPEAMMMFLPVGMVLMAILGVAIYLDAPGTELLYIWSNESILNPADEEHFDHLAYGKSALLNPMVYLLTIVVIAIWALFAGIMRRVSVEQDKSTGLSQVNLKKMRFWSAIFLPIAGFSSAFAIWMWVMSVDTHWYSTLFAWYASASLWVSAISIILLIATFLQSRGLLTSFTPEHRHDLGKYIFGFSVFWTYLWFSQFMLIWYANNGEETQYFFIRFEQFKPIFFLNLGINFILPFFTLIMNSSKRTLGTVGLVAGLVIFGHWLDYYQMIKPGVWYNYEHALHHAHEHGHDHGNHDGHEHGKGNHDGHKHGDLYLKGNSDLGGGKAQLSFYQDAPDTTKHDSTSHATADSTSHANDTTGHTAHTTTAAPDHGNHDGHDHAKAGEGDHAHAEEHQFVMGIHFPGLLELGSMLGFLGLFLFVTFTYLSKASLYPQNDPFLDESEHHHV